MRIGSLPEEERITASSDPYENDPQRHAAISARSQAPFNGEAPLSALLSFITPTELHFKRNHLPVPEALPEAYELQVRPASARSVVQAGLREIQICWV